MSADKNHPVVSKKFDRVDAAIWSREWDDGNRSYEVTFSRGYKDGDNNWKNPKSFHKRDLPHLQRAVGWAADQLDMLSDRNNEPEDQ